MGYYTYFTINVHKSKEEVNVDEVLELVKEKIKEKAGYEFEHYEETLHSGERIKWYDHESDMSEISIEVSKALNDADLVILVAGEGEESPDFWHKYFKNGKMQTCYSEIVYDPYDENKFK